MESYFWVALSAAMGRVARFWLSGAVASIAGEAFPLGTLIINALGSFVIGFFSTITRPDGRYLGDTLPPSSS